MKTETVIAVALLAAVALAGCRQGMYDQAKKEPYEASDFFADGTSARPLPAHTVARGSLDRDVAYRMGMDAEGNLVTELPVPLDRALLERGWERFDAYCSVCHGRTGAGDGMVVQRGFPEPPTYHQARLRAMPVGYFVNVVAAGFGRMPSYAVQVPADDRWAIAAYVKVLQAAQGTPLEELPVGVRTEFESARANGRGPGAEESNGAAGHGVANGAAAPMGQTR